MTAGSQLSTEEDSVSASNRFGNLSFFLPFYNHCYSMSSNQWRHCITFSPQCLAYKGSTLELNIFPSIVFSMFPNLYFGSIVLILIPTVSLINHPLSKFSVLLWILAGIFTRQIKDFGIFLGHKRNLLLSITSGMEEYSGRPLKIQRLLDQGAKALC